VSWRSCSFVSEGLAPAWAAAGVGGCDTWERWPQPPLGSLGELVLGAQAWASRQAELSHHPGSAPGL